MNIPCGLPLLLFVLAHTEGFVSLAPCCSRGRVWRTLTSRRAASPSDTSVGITVLDGPFDVSQLQSYWGQRPLVIRNAFRDVDDAWPSWDDIVQLACWNGNGDDWIVESGESARLIRHIPDKLESFDLELGPFEPEDLDDMMSPTKNNKKWALVMNDVDRYKPALADWMDRSFAFLPRWRRDDAQVSLATTGGGIGPHVDNYDVFLIQASGQRKWLVDATSKLSVAEERTKLIPDIPVSILQLEDALATELLLNQGDMLYLPPRVVHWGTAASDDCMTLSVGCRAPSAADLVARVAESIQMSAQPRAVQRYTGDGDFLHNNDPIKLSLSLSVKESMKELVRHAVEELLKDDTTWDELVGKITTEAVRYSESIARPYSEEDDGYRDIWGETASDLLQQVIKLGKRATLIRAPGISFATSQVVTNGGKVERLFANGSMWEISNDEHAPVIFSLIERGKAIDGATLAAIRSQSTLKALEELVGEGLLQAWKQD